MSTANDKNDPDATPRGIGNGRWQRLARLVPCINVVSQMTAATLPKDIVAGLVVALVLIPSAISYSDLAQCSPIAGLYSALGAMVAFALFTTSRHVIAGPDAAIAILVGAAIGPLADGDPGKAVALSAWLALLAALLLVFAAWLRLGAAADFLAAPVMLGFMNGAAIVILVSQLGKLSGISLHEENTLLKAWEWLRNLNHVHCPTLAIGIGGVVSLFALRRWIPRIPGTIVIFAMALLLGRMVDWGTKGFQVIGPVDTSLPLPVPPGLSLADLGRLVVSSLGLAMLIFPEGVLLGRAMASRHEYEIDPNRELAALGAANLAAGLYRGFAVGASQSRTLINSTTGGQTQLVSFVAAGLVVVFVVFLGSWIATLPTVAIASILVYTAITLIELDPLRKLWRTHRWSALLALCTSVGVVVLGVLPGIMVGVVMSLLRLISQISHPPDARLRRAPGQTSFHDLAEDEPGTTIPGLLVYRFYGPVVFSNIRYLIDRVNHFIALEEQPLRQVILDARSIPEIDVTAAEQLSAFVGQLRHRGIELVIAKAHLPLRQAALQLGLQAALSDGRYFAKLSDAITAFEQAPATAFHNSR